MGNQLSSNNNKSEELKPKSISQVLDYIATYYILTMDFKSLSKLYDKDHCDKLVVLTSDIIERYFTDMEITYLAQRIKDGKEINEIENDKVIFFNRDDLNKLDVQNSIKKKRICLGIAKFYIKIAHLFAAIVTTINPIYTYKDSEGNTLQANLFEKGMIPPNTPREIQKINICDNRINALKRNKDLSSDKEININPNICSVNVNESGQIKNLEEEPGIPELMELYYDDNYDYETGKFTGMSEKTKRIFEQDLQIFYNIFTDGKTMPAEVKKFSDIKLREYQYKDGCSGDKPILDTAVKGSSELFVKYADNLKQMINKANYNQQALLEILNELFVYTIGPQTKKKQIRINPKLTESGLQDIVVSARALIIKLYLTCEIDFTNGIKLYEAIVEQKILETAQSQIENLKQMSETLINEVPEAAEKPAEKTKAPAVPESKELNIKPENSIVYSSDINNDVPDYLK
jgi:hypothetical protein